MSEVYFVGNINLNIAVSGNAINSSLSLSLDLMFQNKISCHIIASPPKSFSARSATARCAGVPHPAAVARSARPLFAPAR
jgi:hypothetical protein